MYKITDTKHLAKQTSFQYVWIHVHTIQLQFFLLLCRFTNWVCTQL